MKNLEGKKILFFAPAFFGYEKKIAEKMEQLGADVDLYDERSVTKSHEKALLKITPKLYSLKTKKYYENIINLNREKDYDYVFVIKCEMLTEDIIKRLRELYSNAVFCLYLYDSLKNIKGIIPKINLFDRVLSFDLNDTKENSNIIFRPLFYLDTYKCEFKQNNVFTYDIGFIGTVHSDRYAVIKKVKEICKHNGLKYYFFCFLQSKFIFYYYKITKKEFRDSVIKDFSFHKLSSYDISEKIKKIRTVLDVQHPKQSGLTMRTIEMLGMNKKLITTNSNIKEYDFYNPNNILVLDRQKLIIPKEFLSKPYQKISNEVYEKYSLEHWIYDVLGCNSENLLNEK